MKQLNRMRLMSGLPIDPSIEISEEEHVVTEARKVPVRKSELTAKDMKTLGKSVKGVATAIKHITQAIKALEKVPAISYSGNVPRFIQELEDLLDDGTDDSMRSYHKACETSALKHQQSKELDDKEDAVTEANTIEDLKAEDKYKDEVDDEVLNGKKAKKADDESEDDDDKVTESDAELDDLEESMHFFSNMYNDHEDDETKPINVSNGSSNDEQVWDQKTKKSLKDEHAQLRTSDTKSPQDQSDGADVEADMKIPAGIKASLKMEIGHLEAEAKKMDTSNKDASYFYKDCAKAFQDLLDHLDKGTRYDFKLAQTFAQSLMGPMIHKLPVDVWKFLTNGGETRSLKDYMKPVKKYIEGPRNTIK